MQVIYYLVGTVKKSKNCTTTFKYGKTEVYIKYIKKGVKNEKKLQSCSG